MTGVAESGNSGYGRHLFFSLTWKLKAQTLDRVRFRTWLREKVRGPEFQRVNFSA